MLKNRIHIGGLRFGKKAVALAMAPVGVAAISFAGLAIAAPGAYAATGCVTRTFDILLDENTYQPCVLDMQVLLNNLYEKHVVGPNQFLATDGYFGINTGNDVVEFNIWWNDSPGQLGEMTPTSWVRSAVSTRTRDSAAPTGTTRVAPPCRDCSPRTAGTKVP